MRCLAIIVAGAIAAGLLSTAAQAAKGGDDFAICESDPPKGIAAKPDKSFSWTYSGKEVFEKYVERWPGLAPNPHAPDAKTVYQAALDYADGKTLPGMNLNALGLLYDDFKGHTAIGGLGFVKDWPGSSNATLSLELLKKWAAGAPVVIQCDADAPPDASKDRGMLAFFQTHGLLRDTANSLEQALARKIDSNFTLADDTSASIAFHHDQLDHTANTFTMHVAAGVGFTFEQSDSWRDGGVVFIGVDRINDSAPTVLMNNATDFYAGAGFVWTYQDGDDGGVRSNVLVQGDTDGAFGASMIYVSGQAAPWSKQIPCLNQKKQFLLGLSVKCSLNFDLDFAHILNAGAFINLSQMEYARAGGDASVTIGAPDFSDTYLRQQGLGGVFLSIVRNFSYTASYKNLRDLTGSGADISRFNSSIDYKLDGDSDSGQSTSVSLKYVNGLDDRTLQNQRYWELALNVAY